MAAPLQASETRLKYAILAELKKIQRTGGRGLWLTTPAVVEILQAGMPPQNDTPGLYLHLDSFDEPEGILGEGMHEGEAVFNIWMATERIANAGDLHESLVRDVRRALGLGETTIQNALNGATGSGSVYLRGGGYRYSMELSEKTGLAIGTYIVTARYVWTHDNP